MLAGDSKEGQKYFLPRRIGERVIGISYGWNYNKTFMLFLLERGKERVIKTLLPTEEIQPYHD